MIICHKPNKILKTIILLAFLSLQGCNWFNAPEKELTANEQIYESFKEWYLWYDQLPEIDPNNFDTQKELLDKLKVPEDRWSFTGSYTQIKKLLEGGEYTGFGAGFVLDYDNQVKISKVYTNSPMGRLGAQRGWIVNSVNGFGADKITDLNNALSSDGDVVFVLTDSEGMQLTKTMQREAISMNTVIHSSIIEIENHKIGYLVFDSFLEVSHDELQAVFENFQTQNLTDLVVDLRYNGGGMNTIAYELIGMIGGDKVQEQEIAKVTHNDKKSSKDISEISTYIGPKVNLSQVYFITTSGTASASELVINCLTPFMDVKLIGSTTHGKPVGMYILHVDEIDLAIAPIAFKNVNHDGYGDYFDGMSVNIQEIDDLTHNWGNVEEKMLAAAINDILGNIIISSTFKSEQINHQKPLNYPGIYQFINAF